MKLNVCVLAGNLTRDPETRSTSSGKTVTTFGLAVSHRWRKDHTDFFDVEAWNKPGEVIAEYLHKGDPVIVRGHIEQQRWEKDGQKRSKVVVVVDEFSFAGKGGEREAAPDDEEQDEFPF